MDWVLSIPLFLAFVLAIAFDLAYNRPVQRLRSLRWRMAYLPPTHWNCRCAVIEKETHDATL